MRFRWSTSRNYVRLEHMVYIFHIAIISHDFQPQPARQNIHPIRFENMSCTDLWLRLESRHTDMPWFQARACYMGCLFVPRSFTCESNNGHYWAGARRCDVLMTVTSEAGASAWPLLPIHWQITGPLHAVDARGRPVMSLTSSCQYTFGTACGELICSRIWSSASLLDRKKYSILFIKVSFLRFRSLSSALIVVGPI